MYDPETAHRLLTLGNNLARQIKPELNNIAELTIPLPEEEWLCVLGRSNPDAFTDDGFIGGFNQLQIVIPRVPFREDQFCDIVISTGEGIDPGQHPSRDHLPEHIRSQLGDGDVTIMSFRTDKADDVPVESRANEVFPLVDSLITMLGQMATQNTGQSNVQ